MTHRTLAFFLVASLTPTPPPPLPPPRDLYHRTSSSFQRSSRPRPHRHSYSSTSPPTTALPRTLGFIGAPDTINGWASSTTGASPPISPYKRSVNLHASSFASPWASYLLMSQPIATTSRHSDLTPPTRSPAHVVVRVPKYSVGTARIHRIHHTTRQESMPT
jgi:hypothetical protein